MVNPTEKVRGVEDLTVLTEHPRIVRPLQMRKTLEVINKMLSDGVIGNYAIGGAVGATFWLEPVSTDDVDIFISLGNAPGSGLVLLSPIYEYLGALNYQPSGVHIIIEGEAVQFLPADDPLNKEALLEAVPTEVDGVETQTMTAEHLMAIALKTGRYKDRLRVGQFYETKKYDANVLRGILERHGLSEKWEKFKREYDLGTT